MRTDRRIPRITATQQTEAAFLQALGRAFTRWQHVETAFYVLAHGLMRTSPEISSLVFFHIRSAENKIGLLDKLCHNGISQVAYQRHWVPLRKSLENPIDVRNSMAHFEVVWLDDGIVASTSTLNMMIYTHHLDTHANRGGGRGLTVEALRQADCEFKSLAEAMIAFGAEHVPDWPQQAASLPQRLQQYLQSVANKATPPTPAPPRGSSPG